MKSNFANSAARITRRQFFIRWLAMFALLAFVGAAFTISTFATYLANQRPITWLSAMISQLLHFLVWAAMCPAFIFIDQRVRAEQKSWPRVIGFHLLAGVLFSLAQIGVFGFLFWALLGFTDFRYPSLMAVYQAVFLPRFVLGVVIYKIIVTTNYALDYYDKYRAEKLHSALLESHLAEAQLQALKMQLQPHFLFNTLNSISSLVLEEPRAAVQMIARLGDFLRLTIENNGTQQVSMERELEFLKCYLEIQQVRFRDRLSVTMNIQPELLTASVPNLILQPLVENAIKHGIAPRAAAGRIEIKAERLNGKLRVLVSNDGSAEKSLPPMTEGTGLSNTRERLRQLYQDAYRLELELVASGGAVCTLEIPFAES